MSHPHPKPPQYPPPPAELEVQLQQRDTDKDDKTLGRGVADVEEVNDAKVGLDGYADGEADADVLPTADRAEYLELCQVFDEARVRKLTRKTDWTIIPPLLTIYLLSYIDRSNIGNARLFGMEADLGLSPSDWNIGLSLLFITFALCGPPCNALVKIFGPKLVLSTTFLCISVVVVGTGVSNNKATFFAMRLLLGVFEAGIWPSGVFVLSTWYTPSQLSFRVSIFYLGGTISGALSGLLAFGIGQLDYRWGYRGWRWIYVMEGVISFIVAIAAFFWISESPDKARRFTPEERRFIVLRGRYAYGGNAAGSKDDFTWKDFASAAKSWHVWVLSISSMSYCVGAYSFSLTAPTIMNNMGFSAANAQALTAPPYVFAVFTVLVSGWLSDKYKKRALQMIIPSIMASIGIIVAMTTVAHRNLIPLSYIALVAMCGGFLCLTPALGAWVSLNTAGQSKRAAAVAMSVVFSQIGGVVGSNIFLTSQRPTYPLGFGMSLGCMVLGNILLPAIYWVLVGRVNARNAAIPEQEIREKYSDDELAAMGDRSPLYRYER